MGTGLLTANQATYGLIPGSFLFAAIHVLGLTCFAYIVIRRLSPLLHSAPDFRFDRPFLRFQRLLQFWVGQWKHPRYPFAGTLHILIFSGFVLLAIRAFNLLLFGGSENFDSQSPQGFVGHSYAAVTDYAATMVFLCMLIAVIRRLCFKPNRYAVPAKYGKSHEADAIFLLGLIAVLMVADSLFEASRVAHLVQQGEVVQLPAVWSLAWRMQTALARQSSATLFRFFCGAYVLHQFTFYFLLCYRPFGIQFHVETSFFNVLFAKLDRGTIKPARWGVSEKQLEQMKSIGVKQFEDFTWKHMLDFYSCADCGRCSDNCPANAVGRPLSPRFLTIKARDHSFQHYPVFGRSVGNGQLVGNIYSQDEIWSCTTCGACEEECPLLVEYIDKIVDLRRGLIDNGEVPQSLQRPLKSLESRGNPYGKLEKKRGEWAKAQELQSVNVKILNGHEATPTLYFVDSITSYDDRMQSIAQATARILNAVGEDFGILGAKERDSGHEVRRFGEELLFRALRDENTEAIEASGVQRIVTADPHAFNALKHDYVNMPTVEHIGQVIARQLRAGRLRLKPVENKENVYTYHDPCYLGRHNRVYDDPRYVLDSIPGLKRVEMQRSRDRSFCCGGGGLMLFYEPKEEQRMGVLRVKMAAEAGANVIVTACPYCMANLEDAIKVAGLEGKMTAIDLAELVESQIGNDEGAAKEAADKHELATVAEL